MTRIFRLWTLLALASSALVAAPQKAFQEHGQFLAAAAAARFEDVAQLPGAKARDRAAFEEMKKHLASLYEGVTAAHSYRTPAGDYVDCIPLEQQPALRRPEMRDAAIQREPSVKPAAPRRSEGEKAPRASDVKPAPAGKDDTGRETACPAGTIPMRRVTLEEMARFATLQDFFSKSGGLAAGNHYYARGALRVSNYGATSYLNLWSPSVQPGHMSLSQLWVVGGEGQSTQTVEAGWQVYPAKYGTTLAVPFIFFTNANYAPGSGCYNLECLGFVQVSSAWTFGVPWPAGSYSTLGGEQQSITYSWVRDYDTGNWWLELGGTWVGYYPRSLFGLGQLSIIATTVAFGGETAGQEPRSHMGSGRFAANGFRQAAFQAGVQYYDVQHQPRSATLIPYAPTPLCYTFDLHNGTDGNPTYFYYGGPGCS